MSDKLVKTWKDVMLIKMNQNQMHTLNKFDDENKKDKIKMHNYEHCCYTNAIKRKLNENIWTESKIQSKNKNISQSVNVKYIQNDENCCCSQSIKFNDSIKSKLKIEDKTAFLLGTTEIQEEADSKYTFKDYSDLVLVTFMTILYIYFTITTNLVGWIVNYVISQAGSFLKFLIKLKIRVLSFNKFSKRVERAIKGLSLCFKSKVCKYPVELASASLTFTLNCYVIHFVTLLLFLGNVDSLPYLEFIITAFVSLLL